MQTEPWPWNLTDDEVDRIAIEEEAEEECNKCINECGCPKDRLPVEQHTNQEKPCQQ